ncbi:of very long chain fatty acids protein 6 [Seminavis robusta]|uniref:Elongation of fatty acids protein n=1 Tax=Seminavis robusta TaxID=568900 RepID=A0A9N8DZN6_9STRA|nr:of very long chain fatty acids protein 6 [Seminavis robusta]|eukprot:Sro393_g133590.1 of very long chain fatty acids protein 6 (299) ;mRNA; f:24689-25684
MSTSWYATLPSGACTMTAPVRDAPYEDFGCLYPTFAKTFMNWEMPTENFPKILEFMENNSWLPIVTVTLYAIAIFWGQHYMADKPAWDWRKRLAAWNLFLAVFSGFAFMRLVPHLLHNLWHYDFQTNVCADPYTLGGFGPTPFWGTVFAWSKFAELIDTFFIVVRKKKLMFLHWYHHITVLLCCWHTMISGSPSAFIFCVVNYGVHTVMYFYYFLMAVRCKPKWMNPKIITVAQILQMVVGVGVCVGSYKYAGKNGCFADPLNIRGTLFMYASYLYLFCEFFFKRYLIKTGNKKSKAA